MNNTEINTEVERLDRSKEVLLELIKKEQKKVHHEKI